MLPEEALVKAAASLLSGTIGLFVLAGSRKRAANVFLAAFLFLLAGNQFAETMRALASTASGRLFWFRIASVFAFLDPLALYYFGSVFPERNRLNNPLAVGTVLVFCVFLTFTVPFLQLDWRFPSFSSLIIMAWAVGTVLVYWIVLYEALVHVKREPSESASAELVPALCVLAVPAVARSPRMFWDIVSAPESATWLTAVLAMVIPFVFLLREVRRIPATSPRARRLVALGAWGGLVFAFISNPQPILDMGEAQGWLPRLEFRTLLSGAGDALKLLVFGVAASAAILRQRMLDLSLETRRWAARVLAGSFVVAGLAAIASFASQLGGESLLAEPALLALLLVVLVATQGFRRLVEVVAEKAYGVPRGSRRVDKIEAYRAAVEQAREEGRTLGSDPRLHRLREELELGEHTAGVVERMHEGEVGGPLVPGERLQGRYRIEAFLGRGGSGRAFRARDELLDRNVAIKEVLDGGAHETARALREARIAGQLDHPNVITVHDVLQRPGASLLVTEFAERGSLAELLDEHGSLPPDRAFALLDGILSGLEAVHAEGIVHGDLKPSNVLVDEPGIPKITDFGASRLGRDGTWTASEVPPEGTPAYMAPEQRRGEQPSERSDVYAVALLAEEMWRSPIADPVERVLHRARASDLEDRFASAAGMREALRVAERGATLTRGR